MNPIDTIADTATYSISTRLLMQEALRKGYSLHFFTSSPRKNEGITHAVKKDRELYFKSTCPMASSSLGYFAAEDKVLTYSLLSASSISMPYSVVISRNDSLDTARDLLNRFDSLVVKPTEMNHGDGVSVGIHTEDQLVRAIAHAREAGGEDTDILVQQQIKGSEYRFLVVDGKVVAVASRRPPYITGNGVNTIEELIQEKNNDPRRGEAHSSELTKISIDDVKRQKGEAFLTNVPRSNEEIVVLDTSNLSRGGEALDFTDEASPALKRLAVDAARITFLGVAGVDIITNDIGAATVDESFVIEVNLAPGIRMHHYPSVGTKRDVAKLIFSFFEKNAKPINKKVKVIGRAEKVKLSLFSQQAIPARIDTGAVLSSLWASSIKEVPQGLEFVLFDSNSPLYTGDKIVVETYNKRIVSSSMGHREERYMIKTTVQIKSKPIRARFTLANRASQVYPILIGRNVLRNNFIVDVYKGKPDREGEQAKRNMLDVPIKEIKK